MNKGTSVKTIRVFERQVKNKTTMNEMEEMINQKFKELLYQYIEKHDMKQKDIAAKLGEDESTISKFMKNTNWGIPKLAIAARRMKFDFEKEYQICDALINDDFRKHMEQKQKCKKKRGSQK